MQCNAGNACRNGNCLKNEFVISILVLKSAKILVRLTKNSEPIIEGDDDDLSDGGKDRSVVNVTAAPLVAVAVDEEDVGPSHLVASQIGILKKN